MPLVLLLAQPAQNQCGLGLDLNGAGQSECGPALRPKESGVEVNQGSPKQAFGRPPQELTSVIQFLREHQPNRVKHTSLILLKGSIVRI